VLLYCCYCGNLQTTARGSLISQIASLKSARQQQKTEREQERLQLQLLEVESHKPWKHPCVVSVASSTMLHTRYSLYYACSALCTMLRPLEPLSLSDGVPVAVRSHCNDCCHIVFYQSLFNSSIRLLHMTHQTGGA
jgi:hypothetical protein